MSAFRQSFIEKLLHSAHGVVIMHASGAFGRSHRFGNLLVRQSLRHAKGKYFSLRGRQPPDSLLQSLPRLVRHHRIQRVIFSGRVVFLNLVAIAAALVRAPTIEQEPALDGKQPRPKRAFPAKTIERVERADEGVLHELINVVPLARADGEPGKSRRVAFDQLASRALVARLPSRDEL